MAFVGAIWTGEVAGRTAGGGSGALGSWMGEVALLAGCTVEVPERKAVTGLVSGVTGEVSVRAAGGGTRVVPSPPEMLGNCDVPDDGTCAVASFGCVTPAPGRARRVMRTVSFFSGTAEVLATGVGGGVGWVLLSLMVVGGKWSWIQFVGTDIQILI